ncbi:helix-turn-helix transcriptional regulator [Aquihabitans sp. McL0605]|uniref:helix-turn-helix transcriptional regulator n=1 Tax=Aquihabitans sp. McL0605 TaxID=3415671 RepID=UPI003CEE786B
MAAVEKVERLLSLMNALLGAPRAISADDLRTRVPGYPDEDASFKRAFERDKDDLREMGVPLLVETIQGTDPPLLGYRIRKQDYELRDPGLEPDELEALNLAAAATGFAGGVGQRALFKLGGGASAAPQAELPADPNLVAAFTGVAERRVVAFGYHDLARVVHPYRLEFLRGRWYLNGFDRVRGEDRWFRMGRIQGPIEVTGEAGAFERPLEAVPGLQLDPWVIGGGEDPVTARVWFDPAVAHSVRADLPDAGIEQDDAEGLVVALAVTNRDGFRSWVLGYLDRAEVLDPPELRSSVVHWLEQAVAAEAGE